MKIKKGSKEFWLLMRIQKTVSILLSDKYNLKYKLRFMSYERTYWEGLWTFIPHDVRWMLKDIVGDIERESFTKDRFCKAIGIVICKDSNDSVYDDIYKKIESIEFIK